MTKIEPVAEMESDGVMRFKKENRKFQIGDKLFTAEQMAQAVAEERERCAKVCEEVSDYHCDEMADYYCSACAAAIRKGE
jgi:hypothetical protein